MVIAEDTLERFPPVIERRLTKKGRPERRGRTGPEDPSARVWQCRLVRCRPKTLGAQHSESLCSGGKHVKKFGSVICRSGQPLPHCSWKLRRLQSQTKRCLMPNPADHRLSIHQLGVMQLSGAFSDSVRSSYHGQLLGSTAVADVGCCQQESVEVSGNYGGTFVNGAIPDGNPSRLTDRLTVRSGWWLRRAAGPARPAERSSTAIAGGQPARNLRRCDGPGVLRLGSCIRGWSRSTARSTLQ